MRNHISLAVSWCALRCWSLSLLSKSSSRLSNRSTLPGCYNWTRSVGWIWHISLELPSENEILSGGWRMLPLFYPRVRKFQSLYVHYNLKLELNSLHLKITKEQVDSFKPRRRIPSCQLTAEWTKESKPSRLIHQVLLKGAKEPSNYLRIVLDSGICFDAMCVRVIICSWRLFHTGGDRLVPHQGKQGTPT